MGTAEISAAVTAAIGFLGLLWAIIRYVIQKHEHEINEKVKENRKELSDQVAQVRATTAQNARHLQDTRDQLQTNYVRHEQLDRTMAELKVQVTALFTKVDAMSMDLNQFIGLIKAGKKGD